MKRLPRQEKLFGVEVGVFQGGMSRHLLKHLPNLHLMMVDDWLDTKAQPESYRSIGDYHAKLSRSEQEPHKNAALSAVKRYIEEGRAVIAEMRSHVAADTILQGSRDFVFIDADHSYGGCLLDIESWKDRIRPGGWLCGHDYDLPGFPLFGVKRAVDESVIRYGWQLELDANYTWFVRIPDAN